MDKPANLATGALRQPKVGLAQIEAVLWSGPLGADRDQAADLTVCRAWWSSNCLGLR
jgi:hypothetical protein